MRPVATLRNGIPDGAVAMFSGHAPLPVHVGVNPGVEGVRHAGGVRAVGAFGDVVCVGGEGSGSGGAVHGRRSASRAAAEVLVAGGIHVRIDAGVEGVG